MRISVDVTQEDIVDLQVGDAVDITFTAYPEDSYTGSILSINTTATSDYSNTVSYTVEISVEGALEKLYGGMTADVIFVTEEKEDVIYVSRKAIVEENGKTYVYRKTALGGKELAEVETGITNGVDIEILSGLEEGDTIYLASKVSSEAEVKSTQEDSGSTADTQPAVIWSFRNSMNPLCQRICRCLLEEQCPKVVPEAAVPAVSASECRAVPEDNKSGGWNKC